MLRLDALAEPWASLRIGRTVGRAHLPGVEFVLQEQIRILYDELLRIWPSPVVALNHAVALSTTGSPEAALTRSRSSNTAAAWPVTATSTRRKPISCTGSAVTSRLCRHARQPSTSAATPPNRDSSPNA